MKPRHIVMGAALALAAGLVVFGDSTPDTQIAEPVERAAAPRSTGAAVVAPGARAGDDLAIARLLPRETLIGDSEDRFGQGAAGLFARRDWTPQQQQQQQQDQAPPPPPPPPSAPPLPFTYLGKSLQDGAWEIYLARGQQTYLVREGNTFDGTYRVDAIRPPTLTLTYLPLDQVQQINIGVFD